jgi:hypothetical protein
MTHCQISCPDAGSGDRRLDAGAAFSMSRSPTRYTPVLAERMLEKLLTGRSLRDACKADGMPGESTVRNWVINNRERPLPPRTQGWPQGDVRPEA